MDKRVPVGEPDVFDEFDLGQVASTFTIEDILTGWSINFLNSP